MPIRGISFQYDRDAEPLLRSRSYRGYLDVLRREGFAVQRMRGNYVTGTWQGETVQLQIWNGEGYLDGSPISRAFIKGKINYDRGWDIHQDPTWKRRIIALAKKLAAAPRYPDDQDDVGEAAGAVERAEAMMEEAYDLLSEAQDLAAQVGGPEKLAELEKLYASCRDGSEYSHVTSVNFKWTKELQFKGKAKEAGFGMAAIKAFLKAKGKLDRMYRSHPYFSEPEER